MTALEALEELLEGTLHEQERKPAPRSSAGRAAGRTQEEKLVAELFEVRAIEEQALTQTRRAARIGGDGRVAEVFSWHEIETEGRLRQLGERIEEYRGDIPRGSRRAGCAGGASMAIFAEGEPRTTAAQVTHAFAYAHLALATCAHLRQTAVAAGDGAAAALACRMVEEGQGAAERLEACFDVALESGDPESAGAQLDHCLAAVHAIEKQGLQLLQTAATIVEHGDLERLFTGHLRESEEQAQTVHERMLVRKVAPIKREEALLCIGGRQVAASLAAQPDSTAKLAGFAYAYEQLEVAAYELLARAAGRAGDAKSLRLAERILAEERAAARRFAPSLPG